MRLTRIKNNKALALVESPLQLMCAYEAAKKINPNTEYLIRFNGFDENDRILRNTANFLMITYSQIKIRPNYFFLDILRCFPRLFEILSQKRTDYFSGSYFSGFLKIIQKLVRAERVYYLDDGVATFLAQKQMSQDGKPHSLFTFFKVKALPNQIVAKHSFEKIRLEFESEGTNASSIFIGQKLVEVRILSIDQYLEIILKAVDLSDGKLIYFPHRGEGRDTVEKIVEKAGVEVMTPDLPIELFLLKNGMRPRKIFSNTSSALFSLMAFFPEASLYSIVNYKVQTKKIPHLDEILKSLADSEKVIQLEV